MRKVLLSLVGGVGCAGPVYVAGKRVKDTKDLVTAPAGSKELTEAAKSTDKTFKSYEGLAHDQAHEPEKQQVMDDVAAWLDLHS